MCIVYVFYHADAALNVRNLLIFTTDVEFILYVGGNGPASALKFRVAKDVDNAKVSHGVDTMDLCECLDKCCFFTIAKYLSCDEP